MVYLFRFAQRSSAEPSVNSAAYAHLDRHAYLHELSPGLVLVAPTCHIYTLRKGLTPALGGDWSVEITPVTDDRFADAQARGFAAFWLRTADHAPPYTLGELVAQFDS